MSSPPEELVKAIKKQKYHIVGRHSAVKRCKWLYESIINDRFCYKQKFYGIKSHRCLQMTPTLYYCTQRCLFCWRVQSLDLGLEWNETKMNELDDPELIVEGCIEAQRRILSGYKGNPKADKKKLEEALNPKHAAISLAGEPTLYARLSELIEEFHKRGFTTFLVSNGTLPEAFKKLSEEPTQLYISLTSPDKETYAKLCRPQIRGSWSSLMKTLELLPSLNCRKVIRITLVKGYNMHGIEKYAKLIEIAEPDFVEPKAYMYVGYSRRRLKYENMPSHLEVGEFAHKLAEELSYNILDESKDSRVFLLSKHKRKLLIKK